jgi:ATP-dependent Clp protease, protease subunit
MKNFLIVVFLTSFSLSANIILTEKNSTSLNGPVTDMSVALLKARLLVLHQELKQGEPIYLILNSPGGSIDAGLELIEFARNLGRPVHTLAIYAASMAFIIHQMLGVRYVPHFGTLMAHRAFGGFRGEFPGQLDSRLNFWKVRLGEIDRIILRRVKKYTMKEWLDLYANEFWINGFESVQKGFSDSSRTFSCSPELSDTYDETMVFFGVRVTLTWSRCPLITQPVDIYISGEADQHIKKKIIDLYEFKSWDSKKITQFNTFQGGL